MSLPQDERRDHHAEMINQLGVAGWGMPGERGRLRQMAARPPGAPLWWQGEEEATARFVAARGL